VAFIERSLSTLRKAGTLAFIVPNKFFGADYGKGLRDFLLNGTAQIASIWDLKDERVFENALISTVVIIIRNNRTATLPILIQGGLAKLVEHLFDWEGKIQIEADDMANLILGKMRQHKSLEQFADVRTGIMGFEYWKMSEIISDGNPVGMRLKLYVNGNFERYTSLWGIKPVNLYKERFNKPVIKLEDSYLNENTISLFKYSPKIIVRGVSRRLAAAIDIDGAGLLVAVHAVIPRSQSLEYVLGLLNSALLNWYHYNTFYSVRIPEGSLKYPVSFLKGIPIPDVSREQQVPIIKFVDLILAAKKHDPQADTTALEREIDGLVYQLYELTPEEIAIVEEATRGK
jgi:hypothetical protein